MMTGEHLPPALLWVKGKAGLGNRMLCALTGLLYARISNRRLIVDWSDFAYSMDGSNSFQKLFDIPGVQEFAEDSFAIGPVVPDVWSGRLRKSANELIDLFESTQHSKSANHGAAAFWAARVHRRYSIDVSRIHYPEPVAVMWSFGQQIGKMRRHFKGENARYALMSDREILRALLKESFKLKSTILEKVESFSHSHFRKPTIGLHVRYMDRKTSIRDFVGHVDRVMKQFPGAQIFLATDNGEAQNSIRQQYGEDNVMSTQKWFPSTGVSMHQNPECPDRLQHAVDALVDMYLLAKCDWLIYPGSSTFSYISSLVSDSPSHQIIDIERFNLRVRLRRFAKSLIA